MQKASLGYTAPVRDRRPPRLLNAIAFKTQIFDQNIFKNTQRVTNAGRWNWGGTGLYWSHSKSFNF